MNIPSRNDGKTIHVGGTNYNRIPFQIEEKLERFAVQHEDVLYGKNSMYFDMKSKIISKANNGTIPDGYLITGTNRSDARFWFVEYELSSHDVGRHIRGQLYDFMKAVENEASKKKIRDALFREIRENPDYKEKIRNMMQTENEPILFLERIIEQNRGLVVVIDENSDKLEEVIDSIASHDNVKCCILEFARFENDAGQEAFLLDTLFGDSENVKANAMGYSQSESSAIIYENIKQLQEQVEKAILALGKDVVKKPTNSYLGFWRNNILFASIHKRNFFLRIGISIKSYELHDLNKVAKDSGRGSAIDLNEPDEIDYALKLVKQTYDRAGHQIP